MQNNQKIPEGWSVKKLGDIGKVSMCKRIMKHETNPISGIPFYKIGTFGGQPDAYISEKLYLEYRHKYSYPKKGDILISAAGTIGRTVVFNGENAYFQDSNIVWLANDETKALNKYLLFYYATKPWYTTTGGAISRLYNENITEAKVLLPPLVEQEKIAEILGTWDEAIEKLSSLIEQKKLLKKGLMQKLLTGKVRLFKTSPLAGEVADLSASEGLDYNDNIKISSHRMYQPYIKEFSRDMRKNSTKAENLLWQKIRNGQLGFKFRRQHQIDNKYIADFVCLEKRLIIELDGGQHNDRPKDKDRTLYLENNNFKVIRFWDNEILQNIDGCLEILLKEISLLNNPSPYPSPARGEGISATYSNSLPQGARKDVECSLDTPHLAQECHPLPQGARKDAECSLDTPHLAQECHPLPQGARKNERFSQPWKDCELSDLLDYEQPSKYIVNEILEYSKTKIPVLTANKAFILGSTDDISGIYAKGTCIIFDDFTTDIKYVDFPFKVKSSAIKILTSKKDVVLKFVFEQMKRIKYPLGGHKRYYLSEYQYITISVPDISEQQAIANVLSTADDEIDLLNKKLTLFKEQKKGLMQQLLTGNIRVKVN